ncbi:nucleotide pyrophosphohydrolase [Thalassobacillus devorans]|uniref:nucleotide pyrophosphohydrolase n=1 Tax=Thalassobacillus devorans TaxID=279813 RepID=UPI000A1CE72A|nr:nucleotide pyrophosphohydrolase [Thalassobacillus devorans]
MNDSFTTGQMQERVDCYISQFKEGYFSPLSMMARMSEEVGELAREVNHHYGEKPKKSSEDEKSLEEELGDVLFVLSSFANSLDIDLSEAFDRSMTKIETRDKNRWTRKSERGKENE